VDAKLKVRIPEHARSSAVKGTLDGKPRKLEIEGRYADFGMVKAGTECTFEFDLTPRVTQEKQQVLQNRECDKPIGALSYQARWRGNTVIELRPESKEEKRMYKRGQLDTGKVVQKDLAHFMSGKTIRW
jgi:hypothetical protein